MNALKTSKTVENKLEAMRQMKRHADTLKDNLEAMRQSDARRDRERVQQLVEMERRQRLNE